MPIELTVVLKDDEKRTLTKSFLEYDPFTLTEQDPVVAQRLKESLDEFKGTPDDVIIKTKMVLS